VKKWKKKNIHHKHSKGSLFVFFLSFYTESKEKGEEKSKENKSQDAILRRIDSSPEAWISEERNWEDKKMVSFMTTSPWMFKSDDDLLLLFFPLILILFLLFSLVFHIFFPFDMESTVQSWTISSEQSS